MNNITASTQGDTISRSALEKDFRTRLENAKRWKENAINRGDDEIVIRATATIDFICEVIMTINNAPTVEPRIEYGTDGQPYILSITNGIEERPTINCKDCDGYEAGYSAGLKDAEIPQGKWICIDDPDDPDDQLNRYKCSECGRIIRIYDWQTFADYPYCHCGADMRGGAE